MEVLDDLDVAEALGAHDAQHLVRLADADLKIQPAAGGQGLLPLFGNGPVEVQTVIAAVQSQQYNNCEMISFRSGREIKITADPEMPWTLDGEREDGHEQITIKNDPLSYRLVQKVRGEDA